jgi:hypothetical protein
MFNFNIELLEDAPKFDGNTPISARMFNGHLASVFVTVFIDQTRQVANGRVCYLMTVTDIPPMLHPEAIAPGVFYPISKLGQCEIDHPAHGLQ